MYVAKLVTSFKIFTNHRTRRLALRQASRLKRLKLNFLNLDDLLTTSLVTMQVAWYISLKVLGTRLLAQVTCMLPS